MEKNNENLVKFFKKVNKMRIKIKKAENPMDSYEEFKDSETDENIIRKGMSQYEDLVVTLKRLKNKKSKILEDIKGSMSKNKTEYKPQKKEEKKIINNNDDKNIIYTKIEDDKEENQPKETKKPKKERKDSSPKAQNTKTKKTKKIKKEENNNSKPNNEEIKYEKTSKKKDNNKKVDIDIIKEEENDNEDEYNNTNDKTNIIDVKSKITPQIKSELHYSNEEFAELEIKKGPKIKIIWNYIPPKSNDDEEKIHFKIYLFTEGRYMFHWGLLYSNSGHEWHRPPRESYPPNSKEFEKALQTEWPSGNERYFEFTFPRGKPNSNNYVSGLVYDIYNPVKNTWNNNFQRDFTIRFRTKYSQKEITNENIFTNNKNLVVPNFILDVIKSEAGTHSWTLMHRYEKCLDIIDSYSQKFDNENWIWILIWLRYSFLRQLTWQRNYNTRPILLGQALNRLSDELITNYIECLKTEGNFNNLIESKLLIVRNILCFLGKGTGNGQEIRDEILKILQRNKIHACFYEEWHQKLHNNSTPDDIIICEALINFLKNKGDLKIYWKTLNDGGITKERMAKYERAIRHEPEYRDNLNILDFENYLKILKSVHASTDLFMSFESCRNYIGRTGISIMEQIIQNKDDNNCNGVIKQIQRVTELRAILQQVIYFYLDNNTILREVLFLDLSLEVYVRQLVEKIIHIKIEYKSYIEEISYILKNIKISYCNFSEFNLCYEDWTKIVEKLTNDNSLEAALKVKSVISRLNRVLSSVIDYYNIYYDDKAKYFGEECKCDKFSVDLFSEELIRGSVFFALSMLLKKIEPIIRKNANLGDWLIISRGKENLVYGKLIHVKNLHEVQFHKYEQDTVLVCENVSGDEEVPINCVCLMIIKSENYPDVLAHVSVRARNLNIPFVVCFNENKADNILKYLDKNIEVKLENQEVIISLSENTGKRGKSEKKNILPNKIKFIDDGNNKYQKIFLELNEFDEKNIGAKSKNTKKVYNKITNCPWLKYPESFAIPFNVEEYFLSLEENKNIKEQINKLIQKVEKTDNENDIINILNQCKELTLKINFINNSETEQLKERLLNFGVKDKDFQKAFKAIKSVWASKFNERVYISTKKIGMQLKKIKMSVLCQKIIPAEYAYVIHTKNPTNNNPDEVFAEVVVGMGETLVGAYEGQSFSFVYNKKKGNYEIKSFPNKGISLRNKGFIFRSDSNMEDLEGFSGAGLFDSVPMVKDKKVEMMYYNDRIFKDKKFVENMIKKISKLGIEVEKMFNEPQDIEGVFYKEEFYIVQTRPQV